ncbi:hypothetical protein HDV00_009904 [Rhizophlyctis rosea]|nr:hypothetical protein HDV00_009904 [Rhizophlyctis rosea]
MFKGIRDELRGEGEKLEGDITFNRRNQDLGQAEIEKGKGERAEAEANRDWTRSGERSDEAKAAGDFGEERYYEQQAAEDGQRRW